MKRAALLFLLLMLLLPALAFADTVLTEIVGEEDENIAVRLVRREDGTTLFVGENRVGGEWITTLSKPLPEGAELYTEDGLYDTAIIGYYRTDLPDAPWVEQHVTWDGESWRITMTMRNAWEMIAWEEERINSDIYDAYYGVFTLPLDVARADWLKLPVTFREAMALMDTAGYEAINASWGPVEDDMTPEIDKALVDFAGEYLPGCTVESGRLFENTAMLLLRDEENLLRFAGAVRTDDGWDVTLSTPLPEGAWCNPEYRMSDGWAEITVPLSREKARVRLGIEQIYVQVAEFEGAWRITCLNFTDDVLGVGDFGYETEYGVALYGALPYSRDIREVDWTELPGSAQQAIDGLDRSAWRVLAEPAETAQGLTLYANVEVRIISQSDGVAQAEIAHSGMTVQLIASCLTDTAPHYDWDSWDGEAPLDFVNRNAPITLLDAPGGAPLLKTDGVLTVLGHAPAGWLLVMDGDTGTAGFIQLESVLPDAASVAVNGDQATVRLFGTDCQLLLTDAGWRIIQMHFAGDGFYALLPNGYAGRSRIFFGEPGVKANIYETDWDALPITLQAAVSDMNTADWYFTARLVETLDAPRTRYQAGVAVKLLEETDDAATVAILGGETVVRIPADALHSADDQAETSLWDADMRWSTPGLEHGPGDGALTFYTAPGGNEVAFTVAADEEITLYHLGASENGYLHMYRRTTGESGFIPADELPDADPIAMAAKMCPQYIFLDGAAGENACIFLMQRPDGETVLTGFTRENGAWRMQESAPLPDTAYLEEVYGGGENIVLNIEPDGCTAEYPLRLTAGWNGGTWLISALHRTMDEEAVQLMENGLYVNCAGMLYGSVNLERDVFRVDWSSFPQRAAEMYACLQDDWGVVRHQSAPLCESADGSIWRTYLLGTPVQILSDDGDWLHVAVFGGRERGYMPRSAVAVGQEQVSEGLGVWRSGVETLPWQAPTLETASGTPLYGVMGGEASAETEEPQYWQVLCDLGDGWYHVLDETDGLAWYVQTDAPMVWPERDAQ